MQMFGFQKYLFAVNLPLHLEIYQEMCDYTNTLTNNLLLSVVP